MNHPGPVYLPPTPPALPRRWPIALAGAAAGALAATAVAALITPSHRPSMQTPTPPSAITVTATPPLAPTPAPLPTAQADRRTCDAWLSVGPHVDAAKTALKELPPGIFVNDPGVPGNPEWAHAVKTAAAQYDQASSILTAGIAAGTTPILHSSAAAAAAALHAVALADGSADAANGNTFAVWHEAATTVNVLCERLAPR